MLLCKPSQQKTKSTLQNHHKRCACSPPGSGARHTSYFLYIFAENGNFIMTLAEAIALRHSVRAFTKRPVEREKLDVLEGEIQKCREAGIEMQLVECSGKIFGNLLAYVSRFRNVPACIVIPEGQDEIEAGYYGERIVLLAQTLGLNSCWVGTSCSKREARKASGAKPMVTIALGYGATQGKAHKSRNYYDVCDVENAPQWFRAGVKAALLAPTAFNRQDFRISLSPVGTPVFTAGKGKFANIDLGIVKCHFDLAAEACREQGEA